VVDRTNSPDPKILLKNTYEDPVNLNALKPEIHVDGDLSNARGIVKIESTGSVLVASNVVAQTIDIATKGDFIKTFSLGFSHLAGDPSLYDKSSPATSTVQAISSTATSSSTRRSQSRNSVSPPAPSRPAPGTTPTRRIRSPMPA
jgi:hypothetical protein